MQSGADVRPRLRLALSIGLAVAAAALIGAGASGYPASQAVLFGAVVAFGALAVTRVFGGQWSEGSDDAEMVTVRSPLTTAEALRMAEEACRSLDGCVLPSIRVNRRRLRVTGRTRISWQSWGERVSVRLRCDGEHVIGFQVGSQPIVPTNIIGHGENRRNVDALRRNLLGFD